MSIKMNVCKYFVYADLPLGGKRGPMCGYGSGVVSLPGLARLL